MTIDCTYTWTDVVRHQCERTGKHTQHVCPCGASTVDSHDTAEREPIQ